MSHGRACENQRVHLALAQIQLSWHPLSTLCSSSSLARPLVAWETKGQTTMTTPTASMTGFVDVDYKRLQEERTHWPGAQMLLAGRALLLCISGKSDHGHDDDTLSRLSTLAAQKVPPRIRRAPRPFDCQAALLSLLSNNCD